VATAGQYEVLTWTVPWVLVPLIQAMRAPLPTGAVLTAAIHAWAPSGGLTWVAVPHPAWCGRRR
jgi:hypothetical protein